MSKEQIVNKVFKKAKIETHPDIALMIELCDMCLTEYSAQMNGSGEGEGVFVICSVRNASPELKERLERYTESLEQSGIKVHLPHRDTNQNASGLEICTQNMKAIKAAKEIHIFYSKESQGTHFDMGVAFGIGKIIKVIENEPLTEGKSYQRMLTEWESR